MSTTKPSTASTNPPATVSTVTFLLKRPNEKEGRRSWSILKRTRAPGLKTSYELIASPILDSLNDLWTRGVQTFEQINKQAEDLRDRLYRAEKGQPEHVVFNQENLALLGDFTSPSPESYWGKVYGRRKRLVDRRTAYYDLTRAVEAIGALSLVTATPEELEAEVARRGYPDNKVRRIFSRLEALLKFIGRTVEFDKPHPEYREVVHLSEAEFKLLLPLIADPVAQALAGCIFHSGGRTGEIFGVAEENVGEQVVYIATQLDISCTRRKTKTRAIRKAFLTPGGREWFTKWLALPQAERLEMRDKPFAAILKAACQKAFPDRPDKWCGPKELRHSYAIQLLQRGVSMSLVAQSLGNSVVVCEKHYTGKELANESIETIASKFRKA